MHWDLLKPALVLGIIQIGLYGFLPISLVLTYRVSRTIAFFHGGVAASGASVYWFLTYPLPGLNRPEYPGWVGLVLTSLAGAVAGGAFGVMVMHPKIVRQGPMQLTIISLAGMMLLLGTVSTLLAVVPEYPAPPAFGGGTVNLWGVSLAKDQFFAAICVLVLVIVLAAVLARTRAGRAIRALGDDVEASVWCGVKLHQVGTAVFVVSGAIAALGGALIAVRLGPDPLQMLFLFLRGLGVALLGGMRSLPLALLGAVIYSMLETSLNVGLFGTVSLDKQELIINGVLVAAIVLIARNRKENFFLLERRAL
jgi:branched-subunit amino acid ABC-type transport system permease component